MDCEAHIYKNGLWKDAKINTTQSSKDHAEITAYSKANKPDLRVYGFAQNGSPCFTCTEKFKSFSNDKLGFVFVVANLTGKSQGGTGYEIPKDSIIVDRSDIFPSASIKGGVLQKATMPKTADLPFTIVIFDKKVYFGGAPANFPISNTEVLKLQAKY